VTLEPCFHFGRTPPCTNFLLKNRIKKVVIAQKDPYHKVAGQSIEFLKNQGVSVKLFSEKEFVKEKFWSTGSFIYSIRYNRPRIILKWAQTRGGFLAPAKGKSGYISNEYSRESVMRFRRIFKNTMAAPGTIQADMPLLNSRRLPVSLKDAFASSENQSFLETLLLRDDNLDKTIIEDKTLRLFLAPKYSNEWKREDEINYINKQKEIAGDFIFLSTDKKQTENIKNQNVSSFFVNDFNDFKNIIEILKEKNMRQIMIEAGPVYSQKLLEEKVPDILLIYKSENKPEWEKEGRTFEGPRKLAQKNDDYFTRLEYSLFDVISLMGDTLLVYKGRQCDA